MGENVAVTLMDPFVDFGSCSRFRMIEPQTIRVYNRTKGKMSCVWVVPGEKEGWKYLEVFLFYLQASLTETIFFLLVTLSLVSLFIPIPATFCLKASRNSAYTFIRNQIMHSTANSWNVLCITKACGLSGLWRRTPSLLHGALLLLPLGKPSRNSPPPLCTLWRQC